MKEQWAAIAGYVGKYAISDHGNVMSMNFSGSGLPGILATSLRRGYLSVCIDRKQFTVHSLVAAAFIGNRPYGLQINHKDGNKQNPRAINLEYCSASENMKHACANGLLSNKGEHHSQSVLTEGNVIDILSKLKEGRTQISIASDYGVNQSNISNISTDKLWSHVTSIKRKVG